MHGMTEGDFSFSIKPFPPSDTYTFETWALEVEQRIIALELAAKQRKDAP